MFDSISHPIFVILAGVSAVIAGWLIYFIRSFRIARSSFDKRVGFSYIAYSTSILLWVLSNTFFYSPLLTRVDESVVLNFALFANLVSFSAFAFACLITNILVFDVDTRRSRHLQIAILCGLTLFALYVNLQPGKTISAVSVKGIGSFIIEVGPMATWFFSSVVFLLLLTVRNILLYSKRARALHLIKSLYMLTGICVFMVSTIVMHGVIPLLWGDFSLVWLPPTLAVSEMLLIGYGLLTSRFYSNKHVAYSAIAITLTSIVIITPIVTVVNALSTNDFTVVIIVSCLVTGFTWNKIYKSTLRYSSRLVYGQKLSPDHQIRSLNHEFQKSTANAFIEIAKALGIEQHDLQLVSNLQDEKLYTSQLYNQNSVLIFEEIEEIVITNSENNQLSKKIYDKMHADNVALVLPIFDDNNNMSHLLLAKKKQGGGIYFYEEIKALQHVLVKAQGYINADRKVHQAQALANSIAHEMRNPLAQVQFQFEILEAKLHHNACREELDLELSKGQMAIDRGRQLIDIILREVNDSSLEQEPTCDTSIRHSITQAVERYAYESEVIRERIKVDISPDFSAKVNETLFNFVIFNLLRNAIYYFDSYPESRVVITTLLGKYENFLVIRDTGPGIPHSLLNRIFDDFFTYSKSGGSGLGLGYCRRVMKSFGGSIQCYSKLDEYTEFHLSFPASTLASPPTSLPAMQRETESSTSHDSAELTANINVPTVMVVDDKEVQRQLVKLLLQQLGYDVILANNGQVAIDILDGNSVDFILMDVQMPVMNGFEAATCIKKTHPNLPIYALSGESGKIELEKISQTMDGRLSKPTTKKELQQTIEAALA
ncbi:response regulator [Vibrio sp. 404]|uniref:histidine kinase n=1 Tax=Vibrio marinisediminis TaxID=2758441 RepID=A0A7W2FR39_9VIBR|nr:response regulator [Vibrio marinisediminis]MBA5762627.1 response regulator [Vibrio marinisediminis]